MATNVSFFKTFSDSLVGSDWTIERQNYDLDIIDTDQSIELEGVSKIVISVTEAEIRTDMYQPEFFELKLVGQVSEVNGTAVTPYNAEIPNIQLNEVFAELTSA